MKKNLLIELRYVRDLLISLNQFYPTTFRTY